MFDDLRKDSESSAYFQTPKAEEESTAPAVTTRAVSRRVPKTAFKLPRLTPAQRLILAVLLLALACIAGPTLLLLTGKIVPL